MRTAKPIDSFWDFSADAGLRLWKLMERANTSSRGRLRQSADTAGAQLDWLKPSLAGGAAGGLYAGPVVSSPPGTVPMVLAYKAKVFTMRIVPAAGRTFGDGIELAVKYVRPRRPDEVAAVIRGVIEEYGHASGQESDPLSEERTLRILGALFIRMPDAERAGLVDVLQKVSDYGICPAMVGLLGDGFVTGLHALWPVMLPLARYADADVAGGTDNEPKRS